MSRFRNAWLALTGNLKREVVERVVFGDAVATTLHEVWVEDKASDKIEWLGGSCRADGSYVYYTTCEQAHTENPGAAVRAKEAIRVGNDYVVGRFEVARVQPKPKVAKGRK